MIADSHGLYDDRIYWKQAVSLKGAGYDVHLILAGDSSEQGLTAEGIPYEIVRRDRIKNNSFINYLAKRLPGGLYVQLFRKAATLKADVYHIHDLKVNRIGKKLKKMTCGPKVIYDVHEPYPENILDYWKGKGVLSLFKKGWSCYMRRWERKAVANYDLIITTEENIQQRFQNYFPGKAVEVIYNYTDFPKVEPSRGMLEKEFDAIYTGGITKFRGAWEILEGVRLAKKDKADIKVLFLGSWFPPSLKKEMRAYINKHALDDNVELHDAVPYPEVDKYYRKSKIGLGIFLPIHTHRIILQIKLFEYMNFGLPILGSNFGHIDSIIQQHQCGIAVNPENPREIADGLIRLLTNETLFSTLSRNGVKASAQYRWEEMEIKLVNIYNSLLKSGK